MILTDSKVKETPLEKNHRQVEVQIEPVGEILKMNVESRGQSVGDNLVRSYPDLGSSAGSADRVALNRNFLHNFMLSQPGGGSTWL